MRKQTHLAVWIAQYAYKPDQPIYILDTSAVIDLQKEDEKKLHELLAAPVPFLIPEGIMYEIGTHTRQTYFENHEAPPCTPLRRAGSWRKKVSDKTWDLLYEIAHEHHDLLTRVQTHENYSNHRLNGYWAGRATGCEKKDSLDIISNSDTHLLALGLTIAAEKKELGLEHTYPILLSSDSHIVEAAALLRDKHRLTRCEGDPNEFVIEDDYSTLIAIRTRQ